jgi:serine/threonine-protein kinase RsbW
MTSVLDTTLPGSGTVELRMDARPENLVLARLAVGGVAARAGFAEEEVADLKLAVTEACTNAIEHGYPGGEGDDEIVIRAAVNDEKMVIEVQDWGIGFDAEAHSGTQGELRDPSELSFEGGDRAGVGLRLIRSLSDELTVTSGPSGSLVAFAKRLSRPD